MHKSLIVALMSLSFSVTAQEQDVDCDKAVSTLEMNHCAAIELDAAQQTLNQYLEASYQHNAFDPELVVSMKAAQQAWQAYLTSHCDAVYTQWREGTIRNVMAFHCETKLTKQRTHEIWQNFLTYMDSTPPVLPEPEL